jgi:hypothetical protein
MDKAHLPVVPTDDQAHILEGLCVALKVLAMPVSGSRTTPEVTDARTRIDAWLNAC